MATDHHQPHAGIPGGYELEPIPVNLDVTPKWDQDVNSWVVKHTAHWVVLVSPMLFNNRVLLSDPEEWVFGWTAGFCYDKGPAAMLAAIAWDPETDRWPAGFKKVAADARTPDRELLGHTQAACTWCYAARHPGREPQRVLGIEHDPEVCCDCGNVTREGIFIREQPELVRFPRLARN